jgi:hypothetical protein
MPTVSHLWSTDIIMRRLLCTSLVRDGSAIPVGTFLDLLDGQPTNDPHYKGATYAIFVQGRGLTRDPPPVGYKRQSGVDPYADYAP